jgi:hypothetical protein
MLTCNRKCIASVQCDSKQERHKWRWRTYLFSFLWKAYQVGCCVKAGLRFVVKWLRILLHPALA